MITPDDLRASPVLALMPEALLERIAGRAADVRAGKDEFLIREGDRAFFWALLEGYVELLRDVAGVERQVTTFDPGESFGEVPIMLGALAPVSARALTPVRLARIDATDFHAMIAECPALAAEIMRTLVRRVNYMGESFANGEATRVTIVGDRYDIRCHEVRDFLSRNSMPYEWLDPTVPTDAAAIPPAAREMESCPTIVLDGKILGAPSLQELADRLGLQTQPIDHVYDLAIVGGGPAGLAAAVYGGSEGLRTIMIEREAPGGQAGTSSRIENYLGFPGGISGDDLASRALVQARRFGTELLVTRNVKTIEPRGETFCVRLDGGEDLSARAVVVATGVSWRKLEAEGAERLVGRGVYYGAARTEALGMRGKHVFLTGGGNSAGQAAMFFVNYAQSVTLLVRGDSLAKSMSHYLIEQLRSRANVSVETRSEVLSVAGAGHLESIRTRRAGDDPRDRDADGLFVFIGADAATDWLPDGIERDERGYLCTGRDIADWTLERDPYFLETSVPGIFAAGDVRSGSIKRVASGVGEGSVVVALVNQFLASREPAPAVAGASAT